MSMVREPLCIIDGIECFSQHITPEHSDFHADGLLNLLQAENEHFWFISRREFILRSIQRHISKTSSFLEIGAGTGFVASGIQYLGHEVSVGDIHVSGLKFARQHGIQNCYQFDLFDSPFNSEFDAVGLFDVIEHLENDQVALAKVANMLKPGGKVFITVPAHLWLWSRNDQVAFHKRRYTREGIGKLIRDAGLKPISTRYFFISMTPLLYLRRILDKAHEGEVSEKEIQQEISIFPVFNPLALLITRLENRIHDWLPQYFGGSLMAIAEK